MLTVIKLIKTRWREASIGLLIVIVLAEARMIHDKQVELEEARLVYANPKKEVVYVEREIQGPEIIKEIIREIPGKERVVETIIYRGPRETTIEEASDSAPVPLADALSPPRRDRYIFGISVVDMSFRDAKDYRAHLGYSIRDRLDFIAGLGYDDRLRSQLQINYRW